MERSNHRIRSLSTFDLIHELVTSMIEQMLDTHPYWHESPRMRRVLRELQRREADAPLSAADCTCADCMGDAYPDVIGPGPFDGTGFDSH